MNFNILKYTHKMISPDVHMDIGSYILYPINKQF